MEHTYLLHKMRLSKKWLVATNGLAYSGRALEAKKELCSTVIWIIIDEEMLQFFSTKYNRTHTSINIEDYYND